MARYQYRESNRKSLMALLIIGILLGSVIGYYVSSQYAPEKIVTQYVYEQGNLTSSFAEIGLAAVDQDGNGIITPLVVEAKPGNGKILTNIEKILFWVDTQQSMQTAKQVAGNLTGIDVENYDLIFTLNSNATLVGGPSAGGALTVATIAALENKKLKSDVMMTGTINPDGTIGEIGGVLEKAKAAKDVGAEIFLVPKGQGTETYLKPEESCVQRSSFLFCTTKYNEVTINIGKNVGISVIEVANVNDALKYFIS
ncbi:hypothetical protein A3K64_00885 [Candidatus Micrarchaeota archaeon RBG_16_36_9]|nr:MAG: hypothetical protein A3K64_00885 [Candidatus Micrarchaeota archaeon RBG_16_36_9]